MIQLKSPQQIEGIRKSGAILYSVFEAVKLMIQQGVTTKEVDQVVYETIINAGGRPAFLNYMGFPASACISINEEVIHGIPGNRMIKSGDLVGVDVGVILDGYVSDRAYTYAIGEILKEEEQLLEVTKQALAAGIEAAIVGNRIRDIGIAVSSVASDYGIVYDYCGHGVGFEVHEEPQVPNVVLKRDKNPRIKPGLVIAIEPMVNLGLPEVRVLEDHWTVVTADGHRSAHYEETIAITDDGPLILTRPDLN